MRRFLPLILVGLIASGIVAYAASPGVINQYNALCGANTPSYCAQPDSSGNLPVTGTFTGTVTANTAAKATAAAPSYVEGSSDDLSQTLTGSLRTTGVGGTFPVTGTFYQATQPVSIASGGVASGAYASGALAAGAISDGADVTQGAKADAASTATDTTPVSVMSVLKEISAKEQAPASRAVTNAGTFAVQATGTFFQATQPVSVASGQIASGAVSSGAIASGAYASGALASGAISDGADVTQGAKADAKSTATDTTQVTVMQVLKEISFMEQTPASRAVTNAGTFAVQSAPTAATTGGATGYVLEPAASDNHAVIKNGAGTVYDILMFNNSATINYWRLYDAGTGFNGCNSATNLVAEGHIPASTSDAGFTVSWGTVGHAFTTGISICVTGAYGQTNTTNATASAISITIGYK